ncbi:SLBB domain-containing protein [Halanaerobacter jeridensis]|uniref:Polysaccharide export outer membrane protein n=1 Tax=Halanaerobacter jeridensis TaxID=706427 RepID=A0A938XX64_9FIRM|nr:polysaccharide biosynthesis/export family protein [Halanaerobacter jeridensis]MBM7556935.1 polysaccharide export outer membrane protein [Halanaerobacter jeridensis]
MKNHKVLLSMTLILCFLAAAVLFTSNVGHAAEYKLTTGDELYISVWGYPDLQQDVVVGPDGQLSFPMIGKVQAEGLTINQLTDVMTEKLKQYIKIKESQVNIVFKKYEQVRVMILGEVNKPGAYQVRPGEQVLNLVSLAGGTTQMADMNSLKLRRNDKSLAIDLEALLDGTEASKEQNYQLQEGDTLYVPKGVIEISVLGEVKSPGSYEVKKGSRVSDVLAKAGGTTNEVADEIKYISNDKEEKLVLDDLLQGKAKNPIVQEGDTIKALEGKYAFQKFTFWRNLFFFVGGLNQIQSLVN